MRRLPPMRRPLIARAAPMPHAARGLIQALQQGRIAPREARRQLVSFYNPGGNAELERRFFGGTLNTVYASHWNESDIVLPELRAICSSVCNQREPGHARGCCDPEGAGALKAGF